MTEVIGGNDQGYFISRQSILQWINELLQVNMTHIEQLGSGCIYCQLVDALYPGRVQLNRVNWKAKMEHQSLQNFKILQSAFDRLGISKKIEVDKLVKGRYHENLEAIQWLKRYIELNGGPQPDYDALSRRSKIVIEFPTVKDKIKTVNKENQAKSLARKTLFSVSSAGSLHPKWNRRPLEALVSPQNRPLKTPPQQKDLLSPSKRQVDKPNSAQIRSPTFRKLDFGGELSVEQTKLDLILSILQQGNDQRSQVRKIREVFGLKQPHQDDITCI